MLERDWLNTRAEVARALSAPVKMVCTAMTGCWMPLPTPKPIKMRVAILRYQRFVEERRSERLYQKASLV